MTESMTEDMDWIREQLLDKQSILLSGPVGTGKTQLAKRVVKEILSAKLASKQISQIEYDDLIALQMVNGNEETTERSIQSKPTQMSNKMDTDKAFTYTIGHLTKCLRYNIPLIIDEANRTSPNFLSTLKTFLALKSGEKYTDSVTGEQIIVS